MQYFITFLEGLMSFVSPCMLPMLPVYVSYFAGGGDREQRPLLNAICFVLGFTVVFSALGLFAGTLGVFLARYQTAVNIITGCIVILFGLGYLEIIPLPFFRGMQAGGKIAGPVSAFLFGIVYSVSLTPCVGAFLGSALMLASASATAGKGLLLLLIYSLGLGIPFLFAAVLLKELGSAIAFIKRHYRTVNLICGLFLILVGICMAMGWLNSLMALFS